MLKIRLARGGSTHRPHYSVVVANARSARDSGYLEKIGFYNPAIKPGQKKGEAIGFNVDQDRLKYWVSVGARPTETLAKIVSRYGLNILDTFKTKYAKSQFHGLSREDVKKHFAEKKAQEDAARKAKKDQAAAG